MLSLSGHQRVISVDFGSSLFDTSLFYLLKERKMEKEAREEEMVMLQRMKEAEKFKEWESQEDAVSERRCKVVERMVGISMAGGTRMREEYAHVLFVHTVPLGAGQTPFQDQD